MVKAKKCEEAHMAMDEPQAYEPPHLQQRHQKNKRKKHLVAEASIVVIAQMMMMDERAQKSYKRCKARCALRDTLTERRTSLLTTEYITVFRMSPTEMEQLRHELYPFLKPNLSEANMLGRQSSNRRPLSVDEKIMIGLMTAGGCPMSGIMWGFGVGHTCAEYTAFDFFKAVVESNIGPIEFSFTADELKVLADGFMSQRANLPLFIGHVSGLDGLAARIRMPGIHECDNPLAYMNRKGFPSLNVQGLADATVRCRMLSIDTAGSTHDSTAYDTTPFSRRWKQTRIKYPGTERYFWISNDEAYGCDANRVSPWPGTGLATREMYKDAFNYYFEAGNHNVIERLWGQVYQRWGILWRPIMFPLRKCPLVITALFRLHNFLKDFGEEERGVLTVNSGPGHHQEGEAFRSILEPYGYDHNWHPQHTCAIEEVAHPRVRPGQCPIRDQITRALDLHCIARPNTGQHIGV
jgi:hypothetical protein